MGFVAICKSNCVTKQPLKAKSFWHFYVFTVFLGLTFLNYSKCQWIYFKNFNIQFNILDWCDQHEITNELVS